MSERCGVTVNGTLVTPDTRDTFPLMDVSDMKGGYRSVNTVTEMNNIPEERRSIGMLVYVNKTKQLYRYECDCNEAKTFVPVSCITREEAADMLASALNRIARLEEQVRALQGAPQ